MTARKILKTQDRSAALGRARELATTGGHLNYITIETQLWNEGHFQARIWLDDIALRQELKHLCDDSRQFALKRASLLPSSAMSLVPR